MNKMRHLLSNIIKFNHFLKSLNNTLFFAGLGFLLLSLLFYNLININLGKCWSVFLILSILAWGECIYKNLYPDYITLQRNDAIDELELFAGKLKNRSIFFNMSFLIFMLICIGVAIYRPWFPVVYTIAPFTLYFGIQTLKTMITQYKVNILNDELQRQHP